MSTFGWVLIVINGFIFFNIGREIRKIKALRLRIRAKKKHLEYLRKREAFFAMPEVQQYIQAAKEGHVLVVSKLPTGCPYTIEEAQAAVDELFKDYYPPSEKMIKSKVKA